MNSVFINVCGILAVLAETPSHENCEPQQSIVAPFNFNYNGDTNFLNVVVNLKSKSSDVTSSEIYETGEIKTKKQIAKHVKCQKNGKEKCQKDAKKHRFKVNNYKINAELDIVSIYLAVKTADGCSKNITILEGRNVRSYALMAAKPEYEPNNDCLKPCPCTIEVNLEHACADSVSKTPQMEATTTTKKPIILPDYYYFDGNTPKNNASTSPHVNISTSIVRSTASNTISEATTNNQRRNVLIYVILSVIVTCVIILMIYISVKKYCHRKSQADGTMELNTYATATELVYADLSFVHGDSQLPRCGEEATYAEIVGVLKPADTNVKSK